MLSRRRLLTATGVLAVAGLTGCTGEDSGRDGQAGADQITRDRIVAEQTGLLATYAATSRRHPSLEPLLGEFVDRVEAHVEALRSAFPATPLTGQTSIGSTSPSATRAGDAAGPVPAGRRAALRALADAEEAPSENRRSAVVAARSGTFAALVASIAACDQAHATLLRARARG